MELKQRVAVIAGATGGLGRVVTEEFGKRGLRLVLLGTDEGRLETLARETGLAQGIYLLKTADLENADAVSAAAEATKAQFGRADILLNFVGGWSGGKPVVETAAQAVTDMLGQHFWTTFYLAQAFVPLMVEGNWGRIAVVSSAAAVTPGSNKLPYAVGKAAQSTVMLALAEELKGSGVTANMLVVNTIDTKNERETAPSPKNANWTTPMEIVSALLYLISDDAHGVTGQRIALFGG